MTLLAEDLLLLILDDTTGKARPGTPVDTVLGGALLTELALNGAVEIGRPSSGWSRRKVSAVGPPTAGVVGSEPILATALDTVRQRERTAEDVVNRLGKGLRDALQDRLAARGILERREDKVLGLFPVTRWPAADSRHEDDVRRLLHAALIDGLTPDARTAALVSLLHAVDLAHRTITAPGVPAREVKRRAKAISEGQWAATAVRDAVQAATAATTAVIVAATAAAGAGSS